MTKKIVLSGVFIAIGIVLPFAFHMIEGAGAIFLPMHIPVLMAGFFLSWPFAMAVGVLTPILSAIFTGMPPFFPVMVYMVFELATYGVVASLCYRKFHGGIYVSLIMAMITGRIMAGAVVWVLSTFFMTALPSPGIFLQGAVITGIPGIVVQLVLIPIVVYSVERVYYSLELS